MQVVCLQEEAFYALFDKVVEYLEQKRADKPEKWIDGEERLRQCICVTSNAKRGTFRRLRVPLQSETFVAPLCVT